MKKFLTSLLIGTALFSSVAFGATVTERSDIELVVNGNVVENKNVPIIVNSRTLIPLRDLVTNLGVPNDNEHIIWNSVERTVVIKKDDTQINLTIDSDIGLVNDKEVKLDAPVMIYNNSTYIPARFVGEALNKKIGWDGYDSKVLVRDMEVYSAVKDKFVLAKDKTKDIQKMKVIIDANMGYHNGEGLFNMVSQLEVDIPKDEMYMATQTNNRGSQSVVEEYWKNGETYSNSEDGMWKVVAKEEDKLRERINILNNIAIKDETLYDSLIINDNRTTEWIVVMENDLIYKGILQQFLDMSLQELDNNVVDLNNEIREMDVEYIISKKMGCFRRMRGTSIMHNETENRDMYINFKISFEEINGDFEVYNPTV